MKLTSIDILKFINSMRETNCIGTVNWRRDITDKLFINFKGRSVPFLGSVCCIGINTGIWIKEEEDLTDNDFKYCTVDDDVSLRNYQFCKYCDKVSQIRGKRIIKQYYCNLFKQLLESEETCEGGINVLRYSKCEDYHDYFMNLSQKND